MAIDVGSAVGYLDLDISGFLNGLRNAQDQAGATSTTITGKLDSIGSKLTSVGTKLTATITTPIIGVGTASVKTAANFESAMSKVSAISGATGEDLSRLNEKAKEMGASTKFSATESAEAFQYMAMAGWDTESMLNGIAGIMDLAAADGLDLATTSDIVTDALTAFGLKAEDAGHFADVLATASSSANTNVSMLGESFKYVAPLAGTMGYSVEDTATALGLMANSGIKASQAGTTLRTAITRMIKPTDAIQSAMDELGITMINEDGSMKSLSEVMDMLREKLNPLTEEQVALNYRMAQTPEKMGHLMDGWDSLTESEKKYKTELSEGMYILEAMSEAELKEVASARLGIELNEERTLSMEEYDALAQQLGRETLVGLTDSMQAQNAATIFGQEALSGMLAIVTASEDDYNNLANAIDNADGKAKQMADTMIDNLSGQLTILKSQLEGLAIQIGNILMPVIKRIVEKIQAFAEWLSKLSKEQQELVVKIGLVAAAIGPLLIVIGTLISKVSSTITIYTKLATNITTKLIPAITGISAPVLAVVAVIGVLIAAFVNLWKNNEEFRENILALWEKLKNVFSEFIQSFVDKIEELKNKTEPLIEKIKVIWNKFCEFLAPVFEGTFAQIITILKTAFDLILDALDIFISVFSGDWDGVLNGIKKLFENVWENIKEIFENVLNTLKGIADVFLGWFGTSWEELWNETKESFIEIWESITGFFSKIIDKFSKLLGDMKTTFSETCKSITDFFSKTADKLSELFGNIKNAFLETWENITSFFSKTADKFSNLLDNIKTAFSETWKGIKLTWDEVSPYFENIWNFIKNVFVKVPETLSEFFRNAWEKIKEIWNAVNMFFRDVWEGIKQIFEPVSIFFETTFNSGWESIKNIFNAASDFFAGIWNKIQQVFSNVGKFFWDTFTEGFNCATYVFKDIADHFSWLWGNVKGVFWDVSSFFRDTFTRGFNEIKNVFNGIGGFFEGVWETVSDKARNGMNWFMGRIEDSLNRAIDFLNRWGFELPNGDWFGLAINYVNLPRLEKGGILKKGQVGLLEGNGSEAVIPLEKNLGWIKQIAKGITENMLVDITPLMSLMSAYHEISKSMLISVNSVMEKQNEILQTIPEAKSEYRGGGNTYNFYSPKPIDEYEAKRQIEKAERDLAEGYYV